MYVRLLFVMIALPCLVAKVQAQFGSFASAIQLSTDAGSTKIFYNTQKQTGDPNAIGPVNFSGNLGSFALGDGKLVLTGAEVKTFKGNNNNVCGARLQYRVYLLNNAGGAFTGMELPFLANCNAGVFADGNGPCSGNDQKWQKVNAAIDLTAQAAPGQYVLEAYFDIAGSNSNTSACTDTAYDSNLGNNYFIRFDITPALPVRLLQLSGVAQQAGNLIRWVAADEADFSHYLVQRSATGHSFSTIGKVNSQSKTAGAIQYAYVDATAPAQTCFYRLMMVDKDGQYTLSKVIRLAAKPLAASKVQLYPNPVQQQVHFSSLQKGDMVLITDAGGKQLYCSKAVSNSMAVPVAHWASGTYYVQVVRNSGTEQHKFMKE